MDKSATETMFSNKSNEWSTPNEFYEKLDSIFNFTLDPCATDENHKCDKFYTMEDDGLVQDWGGEKVFVNPPYSENTKWLEKCYNESQKPNTIVVVLIPSRTDTKYWHNYAMKASHIYFVKGRLKFGNQRNSAPFPSAVLIFRQRFGDTDPQISTIERK
jgi:site-specific DNA-methyltransferase (adenine-specific)